MTEPRTPSRRLALAATLALLAGCGSEPAIVDTAETIRPESAKPAPAPAATPEATTPAPEATPAKEAPKG